MVLVYLVELVEVRENIKVKGQMCVVCERKNEKNCVMFLFSSKFLTLLKKLTLFGKKKTECSFV